MSLKIHNTSGDLADLPFPDGVNGDTESSTGARSTSSSQLETTPFGDPINLRGVTISSKNHDGAYDVNTELPQALSRSLPDFRHSYTRTRQEPATVSQLRAEPDGSMKMTEGTSKINGIFSSSWLSGASRRRSKSPKQLQLPLYTIEYSVFRPMARMRHIKNEEDLENHQIEVLENEGYSLENGKWPENHMDPRKFKEMVNEMVRDVETDLALKPVRISQGSSGSYFILGKEVTRDRNNVDFACSIIKRGIFKPKDEEPYGPLSPKWLKWLHRTFFPCFFGRSCLIPNLGYISEAAACVLDQQLMLYIVPYTDIIHLKSKQFYYTFWERTRNKTAYKIGSFQCFLNGYVGANVFLKQHPFPNSLEDVPDDTFQLCHENDCELPKFFWSKNLITQFQDELEQLVILDYIMRNTDRGADNWMIKVEWVELGHDGLLKRLSARLKIGAIDSGLAFPWKHPDEWRLFPFGWLFLPYYIIGRPFSNKARKHYLPLLTSKFWWEQTTVRLKAVFQKDADFKERMWHKQIAVLKGQAFNVVEVLKLPRAGPLELTRRENLLIWNDTMNVPTVVHNGTLSNALQSSIYDISLPVSNVGKPDTSAHSETTPLLHVDDSAKSTNETTDSSDRSKNRHMSGFDYNMKFEHHDCYCDGNEETNTRTVIIERMEKVYSKRPVFTWC